MTVAPWLLLILGVALVVAIIVLIRTNPKPAAVKPPKYAPRHKVTPARDPHDLPLVADADDAPGASTETDQ